MCCAYLWSGVQVFRGLRAEVQGWCQRTFSKGAGVMQGNATSFRGLGFSFGAEYPKGSEMGIIFLAMNLILKFIVTKESEKRVLNKIKVFVFLCMNYCHSVTRLVII